MYQSPLLVAGRGEPHALLKLLLLAPHRGDALVRLDLGVGRLPPPELSAALRVRLLQVQPHGALFPVTVLDRAELPPQRLASLTRRLAAPARASRLGCDTGRSVGAR